MKRVLLTIIFVFSLALNLTVAGTLGWYYWGLQKPSALQNFTDSKLTDADFNFVRKQFMGNGPGPMREFRNQIMEKRTEVLDLLAKNTGNPEAAEPIIQELAALTGQLERQAAARISRVMAALPDEKRQQFLALLKNRACFRPGMGPGLGMGHGRGRGWRHPGQPPCSVGTEEEKN